DGAEDPALRELAGALADGTVPLDAGAERDEAEEALRRLPGTGAVTAALIRMRGLGDPDVDPWGMPGTERLRPWRSYAVRHLRPPRRP
ncbi:DNA-3-methyladenine glycosylase 2 family protein, partial [Streptomyces halstedii]|nr:DNA-3-methyladenine glycosylase 2 family protein [Streptomyces halstedii]